MLGNRKAGGRASRFPSYLAYSSRFSYRRIEISHTAIGAILGASLLLFAVSRLIAIRLYEKREL